jgi:hypothetical protein
VGWRFQRRKKILPGVTLSLGKRSGSVRVGRRGAGVSLGRGGLAATSRSSAPGSGTSGAGGASATS